MQRPGEVVLWHDLECSSYAEDLPLWRELAAAAPAGPILDVGAGTGRVALDLAARGHEVVALDLEEELLAALRERAAAADAAVTTAAGDARALDLDRSFPLIIVPMQTVQLFGGPGARAAFLQRARAHLAGGGLLALAIADPRDGIEEDRTEPPLPDIREIAGTVYASRAIALYDEGSAVTIERVREVVDRSGRRRAERHPARAPKPPPAPLRAA